MTPTRKGLYAQCQDCIHKTTTGKYPCSYSHKAVRVTLGAQYERDFKVCGLKEK